MGEHDNDTKLSSSDAPQEYRPRTSQSLSQIIHGRQHASWSEKSKSRVQQESRSDESHNIAAVSYHDGDIARHGQNREDGDAAVWRTNEKDLQSSNMVSNNSSSEVSLNNGIHAPSAAPLFAIADNAPSSSSLPFLYPLPLRFASQEEDDGVPHLEKSNVSMEHDYLGNQSSPFAHSIAGKNDVVHSGEGREGASVSSASSSQIMDDEHSITNSNCVHVGGTLAELTDNDNYSENEEDDNDEGGIVILDEATEDDYAESMRVRRQLLSENSSPFASTSTRCTESQKDDIVQASMYETDSIVFAAAARVDANPTPDANGNASLEFEQLLQEADDQYSESDASPGGTEEEGSENDDTRIDAPKDAGHYLWRRNPFASSNRRSVGTTQSRARATTPPVSLRTPVRATRIRHDKYVVEIDIFPSDASNNNHSRFDIRDAMDVMANMELLHLWFDPVPAVFDAAIKDGSGNGIVSPRSSPDSANNNRQYDGQWVEISTPPLSIPSDSRISGCLRAIRVGFRSLIGFPSRIRSMIFVERSCGRIGITLGPYPDGFLCNSGTMAYHSFNIRMSDEESSSTAHRGRCVVISDEVRLQRGGGDEGFDGTRSSCCICSILRFLLGIVEWALLLWYQPDLASYMQQTISSMNKLRALMEHGESAAYADGNDWDWEGANSNGTTMGTPLLG